MHDVIIVGGGPAGLSAALVLGRCRRRVLLFSHGATRNAKARAMHGYLSRDGMTPAEFLEESREQIAKYDTVELRDGEAVAVRREKERFTVTLRDGTTHDARILLLATGLADEVPALEGIERFYGASVHLCPYCDGWEHRDQAIVVHGRGQAGADLAMEMLAWTPHVTWCTDATDDEVGEGCWEKLEHYRIPVVREKIARLEGEGDQLRGVRLVGGEFLPCEALFFAAPQHQRSPLAEQLGCATCADDVALEHVDAKACGVPGLYLAGNTGRGLQLVIMAAASGTLAAFRINQDLLDADLDRFRQIITEEVHERHERHENT